MTVVAAFVGFSLLMNVTIAQAPPLPGPATRPRFDPAAQAARDTVIDARLDRVWASNERWTCWPVSKSNLQLDANGHVWCLTNGNYTTDEFKRSVERATAGRSPSLHGGRVLILDTLGRYWCEAAQEPNTLLCYDGKQWLAPHAAVVRRAPATAVVPAASQPARLANRPVLAPTLLRSQFAPTAIDDGAGNVYFLTTSSDAGPAMVHRFSRDGIWSTIPFPAGASVSKATCFARQPKGRVVLYTLADARRNIGLSSEMFRSLARVSSPPTEESRSLYLCDGRELTAYPPKDGPETQLQLSQTVPLPDGSILHTYINTDRVTLSWPAGTSSLAGTDIGALIKRLDADDFLQRESARRELMRLGEAARDAIEAALTSPKGLSAEQHESLRELKRQFKLAEAAVSDPDAAVFGHRYGLRQVYPLCRPADGSVILLAMKTEDQQAETQLGPSLIAVSPSGEYSVTAISENLGGVINQLNNSVLDGDGNFWIGDKGQTLLDSQTMTLVPTLPIGTRFNRPLFADTEGRVFFEGSDFQLFVCNTKFAERKSELPLQITPATFLAKGPGSRNGWAISKTTMRIQPNGVLQAVPTPGKLEPTAIRPMRGNSALVMFSAGQGREPDNRVYLFDGTDWHEPRGNGVQQVIRNWQPWLTQAAPRSFTQSNFGSDFFCVGSDRDQGIWASSDVMLNSFGGDFRFGAKRFLEYFDGRKWLDVWSALSAAKKEGAVTPPGVGWAIYGTVDDGRLLLLRDNAGVLRGVLHNEDGLKSVEVDGAELMPRLPGIFHAGDESYWWVAPASEHREIVRPPGLPQRPRSPADYKVVPATPGQLITWRNGKLVALPWCGKPVSIDSQQRLWCVEKSTLSVLIGSLVARCDVADLNDDARVLDSADGRLWLMSLNGLNELNIAGTETQPTLSVGRTWKWPAIANNFGSSFIDDANGLWIIGDCGSLARITLPAP